MFYLRYVYYANERVDLNLFLQINLNTYAATKMAVTKFNEIKN